MKILILSLKGLGDTLMMIPLLRAINRALPAARLTVLVPDSACEDALRNCPFVRAVKVGFRHPRPALLPETLKLLFFLRREKFDASITTFPSNKLWYNLLARWTGAPRRITHSYAHAPLATLAALQNLRIPAEPHKHEVEHNMDLLAGLALDPEAPRDLAPWLTAEDEAFAEAFIRENGLGGARLAGLHPAVNPAQIYKAWAPSVLKTLAALADWLCADRGLKVIVFCGPDEKEAAAAVLANAAQRPALCAGASVTQAAALIKRCSLFVNTDSGLGHLAAAVGVPSVTVFGPSNPAMTAPYGRRNAVVGPKLPCAPCYDYPYASTRMRLKCGGRECLHDIDLARLKAAAASLTGETANA
ncbi:MAG: glycosyltransferase family 9 protein [Elusimicrobiales bacterium]|nr:glycosyltransferase family 9 protein [Elusimicrobiales bacterium]